MTKSHPRLSLPSLAAAALVIVCTQAAAAQDAPRPVTAAPAAAEATAPAKAEAPAAKEAAAPLTDAPTASASKPATAAAAPEKCACEVPDENEPAPLAPAAARGNQLFASAAAPRLNVAPELFPRTALRDEQSTSTQQQPQQQQTAAQWTPLTNEQKMKRAARNAFFNPIGIGRTLVSSIITQAKEEDQPHKTTGDKVADGATRFAINFSRRATRSLLGSGAYPVLFNQDPRYDRADPDKSLVARAGHAVSRVFVQRGDSGKLQPAVSRWAGSLSASALSNLWERSTPGHDRIGADATFKRFYNSFISDSINNLFVEFLPDIKKIFGR